MIAVSETRIPAKTFLTWNINYTLKSTISFIFLNQLQQNPQQVEPSFIYQVICGINQLLTLICIGIIK